MEHALVLVSIVLGVAITLELESFNRLIRSKHVRWHWAQVLYAAFALLIVIYYWWILAGQADEPITLGQFLPIMGIMILLVLTCATALPEQIPEKGQIDLAVYYMENRKYQWGLLVAILIPLAVNWLATLYVKNGLWFAVKTGWSEYLPILILLWLVFANKWWKVAIGYLAISFVPIVWLSRTLG
jgi:hypothetical protein